MSVTRLNFSQEMRNEGRDLEDRDGLRAELELRDLRSVELPWEDSKPVGVKLRQRGVVMKDRKKESN